MEDGRRSIDKSEMRKQITETTDDQMKIVQVRCLVNSASVFTCLFRLSSRSLIARTCPHEFSSRVSIISKANDESVVDERLVLKDVSSDPMNLSSVVC